MKTKISASIVISLLVLSCAQKSVSVTPELPVNKNWAINLNQPPTNEEASKIVAELLKSSKVIAKEYFCIKNDLVCRVHYTLGKPNGDLIDPFYIAFVAADRSQASQGYFFPVEGKTNEYIRFEDFTFDGTVNINQVVKENVTKIERSKSGSLLKIENAVLPKLGTTKYTEANITVTDKATVIEGIQRDKADPKFEAKATTEYLRTKLTE